MQKEKPDTPKSNSNQEQNSNREPGRTPGMAEGSEATVDEALSHKDQDNQDKTESEENQ